MLREPWRAEMLGRITLRSGGEVYDRFRERKMVALFALLSLQGKRFLTRNELVERLWPDESPDISRNRFRVTLHHLKHLLEPVGVSPGTVLQTGREEVYLQPAAFTSDVNDLAALLDTADKSADAGERIVLREQAVTLYRGEFLPGFEEEWVEQEREALARRHFHALRGLSRDLLALKEPARGLVWAFRAISLEPLEEEAHFDLMRLYALGGQASEALRHYEQFQALLMRELNAQPSPATQKLAALLQNHLGHEVKTSALSPASLTISAEPPAQSLASAAASPSAAHAAPTSFASPINAAPPRPALPMRLTRFFGREQDIATLCALLAPERDTDSASSKVESDVESDFATTRLVTLAGPGGMGKTRLALEVGDCLLGAYAGRVYFVGMEDAVSPHQLGEALQNALGLPPSEKTDAISQALAVLTQAPCLLILDNLEHLLPEVSASLLHLLTNAPDLRCLVTSRRSVGLDGEREYALGPLGLPEPDAAPASLRDYAGVALFLDRARARRADFALTAQNGPDILRLCRLLEGMPLALELAAARIRVMSAHEMCARFTHALEWLVDARGGKEARHRSLRAAITWSHRMLTPSARRCWHLCSVFAGGFTSEMAVWMCAPVLSAPAEVLLVLEELCAASLLIGREDAQGDTRFSMLEALRVFAGEQREQSEQTGQASTRHLEWFARRIEAASAYQNTGQNTGGEEPGRKSARADAPRMQERQAEEAYFAWAEKEAANLRAALTYGLSDRAEPAEQEQAVSFAANLADHWRAQGRLTEGRDWLRQALALPVESRVKITAQIAAGRLAAQQADYEEAHALATLAAQAAHDVNDTPNIANSRYLMGIAAFHRGHYPTAETHLEVALGLYTAPNDDCRRADCLNSLGMAAWYQGDHASARLYVEGALYIQRARSSPRGVANCLQRLGNIVRDRGDLDGGETLLLEALQTFHGLPDAVGIASCLHDLGVIANFRGDHAQAQGRFDEARSRFQACGLRHGYASCLHNLGQMELDAEHWEAGRVLMRDALDIHRQIGDRRGIAAALHNLAEASRGAGRLDEARSLLLEALAMDRAMGSPVSVAQHLHSLARVYAALDEMPQALAALREATATIRTVDGRADLANLLRTWALLLTRAGQARLAVRIRGATTAYLRTVGFAVSSGEQREDDDTLATLRSTLGEQAFAECRQEGENLSLEQAADEIECAEAGQI